MHGRRPILITLAAGLMTAVAHSAGPAPRVRVLVPAYFYPDGAGLAEWDRLFASPARRDIVAIVNPASGPGQAVDPNYERILDRCRKGGVTPIGYIPTHYAKRPLAEVKADVDRWLRFYPGVRGIFFDEQASGDDQVDYQAALYRYVREEKTLDLVVTNPGTSCSPRFFTKPAADVICLFEGPYAPGSVKPPEAIRQVAAGKFAVLPYSVANADQMKRCLKEAVGAGASLVFLTDAGATMPWGGLPRYWREEGDAVLAVNRGGR